MKSVEKYILTRLQEREAAHSLRKLTTATSLIDFCSNDYLGFANSAELKNNILAAAASHEIISGSTGSRLISGNDRFIESLEEKISQFHDAEAGLIFNSGYDANVGIFSSLPQRGDTIITDELIHASIIDGSRLSFATRYSFRHNDLQSLEEKLKVSKGKIYIAVESIYSMDGDEAPLEGILALAEKYDAAVIVDEAHATGIFGKKGEGLVHQYEFQNRVFARIVTFGKAMGCHGAIILGSSNLRSYLINFARSFIYTTAASPFNHISIDQAYNYLRNKDFQSQIKEKINFFKQECGILYSSFIDSSSAIQCLIVEGNERAKQLENKLQSSGFNVRAILSPTVPSGKERLRICLHTFNSDSDIQDLINILKHHL